MSKKEILNNIFEEDIPKSERTKKSHAIRIIFIILVIIVCLRFVVKYSKTENTEMIQQGYTKHTAQINGQNATVWEYADGTFSARVQYAYCEPLSFTDDCRWDREIIDVHWIQ